MDEESDPSQPSRFISEALRVASSIEQQRNQSKVAILFWCGPSGKSGKNAASDEEFAWNIAEVSLSMCWRKEIATDLPLT